MKKSYFTVEQIAAAIRALPLGSGQDKPVGYVNLVPDQHSDSYDVRFWEPVPLGMKLYRTPQQPTGAVARNECGVTADLVAAGENAHIAMWDLLRAYAAVQAHYGLQPADSPIYVAAKEANRRHIAALAKVAALPAGQQIPDVLFDGHAVYRAMTDQQRQCTTPENVSVVLDAVVRLMRAAPYPEGQQS
jgi:hypothetical protein